MAWVGRFVLAFAVAALFGALAFQNWQNLDAERHYLKAGRALIAGNNHVARDHAEQAVLGNNKNADYWGRLAEAEWRLERYRMALFALERATKVNPEWPTYWGHLAFRRALLGLGVGEAWDRAFRSGRTLPSVQLSLALAAVIDSSEQEGEEALIREVWQGNLARQFLIVVSRFGLDTRVCTAYPGLMELTLDYCTKARAFRQICARADASEKAREVCRAGMEFIYGTGN